MPSTTAENNKRIVKNTLFLYFRMIVVMGIGLYTVRAILRLLGVVDYGIYNVVGGVVSMFAFLNGTLATSSQRYFSIELAKGDLKRLNQWFCLNITTFSLFILAFIVIAETVNVVYQLSIATFCIHFFNIPYNGLIIAHEKMSAFAYISIVEAFLKLGIVFVLSIITWDKLITYGILMFLSSLMITSSYIIYNRIHFQESKYQFYWNKSEMIELLGFSGWHFLGTFSIAIRSQGINILLNLFFSPAVNAARAVAFQIYHAISQLSGNFFTAVKPQIYKSYAKKEYNELFKLIMRSSIITSFLVSILIYPFLANTPYILSLWLKEVPQYAVVFTQLIMINGLIDSVNGPTAAAMLATGKIRNYELIVGGAIIMNLPISYAVLKLGAEPTATMIVSISISICTAIIRAYLLSRAVEVSFKKYVYMFFRLLLSTSVIWLIIYFSFYNLADNIWQLVAYSLLSVAITIAVYLTIAFERDDVRYMVNFIKSKISK